ncbi:hypothetical protein WJX82_010754 [Trebouxia sp. C0006]
MRFWPSRLRRGPKKKNGRDRAWNRFVHQELTGYSPIMTGNRVLGFFLLATLILIPLGAAILAASLGVVEYKARYDNLGALNGTSKADQQSVLWNNQDVGVVQSVNITTTKHMKAPVYVYYELQSFYQNHKRYVRSLVSAQLGGKNKAPNTLGTCAPQQYVNDMENAVDPSTNVALNNSAAVDPCGLMPYSYFNDSYAMSQQQPGGALTVVDMDETNIAWASDKNSLYGHYKPTNFNEIPQYRGGGTINSSYLYVNDDEHFLVWMRPGAARTVRKLYARINSDIPAGTTIYATVNNRYNTYNFGGRKLIVLSTHSWVGGHNNALGGIMLTIGGLAFLTAIIFFCSYHLNKHRRPYADASRLSWNRTNLVK